MWEATAIDPESRLLIGFCVGKRNEALVKELMISTKRRLKEPRDLVLMSDGEKSYETLFPTVFGEPSLSPGAQGSERTLPEGAPPHQQKPRSPAVDQTPSGRESSGAEIESGPW